MLDTPAPSETIRSTTPAGESSDGAYVDVAVVGAGISGLTAALSAQRDGKSVVVLEASSHLGGALKTHHEDGFLVECGPNTVLDTHPEIADLIDAAGLTEERIFAGEEAQKRFVIRDGEPIPLPTSTGDFLRTPLFSRSAKWRLLTEPFIPRSDPEAAESVASFTKRRLGDEFLDYAIDPFVSGVYAGRPDRLGVKEAFPKLAALEQRYGSLILGQILGARERKRRRETSKTTARMFSFRDGLQALPQAIGSNLGERVLRRSRVVGLEPNGQVWTVLYEDESGRVHSLSSRAVVYAGGLQNTQPLDALDHDGDAFDDIFYPPLSVVALGFDRADVGHPLDGFGMLAPSREDRFVLGALFCSTLFAGRAPKGKVLITAFVGGARAPESALLGSDELIVRTVADLEPLLKLDGTPVFSFVTHWPKSIPQYNVGYASVQQHLRELESRHRGLFFAGNYLAGISVGESIKSGKTAFDRVAEFIEQTELP